jgi:hypothetical protein
MNKIREMDMKDKHGNVVISPGLKVRHKESQFEYTVDSVVQDKSGKVMVMLKKPEEPRFDSGSAAKKPMSDKRSKGSVIYESEPIDDFSTTYYTPKDESPDDLIAVTSEEFEKEYDVR